MTFLVTLIASLIERFFDWSHLRNWQWFSGYQQSIINRVGKMPPALTLTIAVLPLLFVIILLQYLFTGLLYGLVSLFFQLLVLVYCLGPRNLWADAFASINALVQGDKAAALTKLQQAFHIKGQNDLLVLHGSLLDNIFIEANRRFFAVVFWYVFLGPFGALLYRLICVSAEEQSETTQSARTFEAILNWLPVRVLTLLFGLGGHFSQVLTIWRKKVAQGLASNDSMLIDCGHAALGEEEIERNLNNGNAERNAIALLDRTFVIMLVIIAICVLLT